MDMDGNGLFCDGAEVERPLSYCILWPEKRLEEN